MTLGQERAVRELERLRFYGGGAFEFTLEDVDSETGKLPVTLSIRLGLVESRSGGLELREREEFYLFIPPDFPFERPSIFVLHDRFAKFPHVIWTHWLCLYQSSLEWNPANGLYGFFERLNLWLGRAAINDMDPIEGPLEPPHHSTDFGQAVFIVRADAPAGAGERWLGFAEIEVHPNRMEIVGWRSPGVQRAEGRRQALALILREAIPMEFPTTGKGLFRELVKQGFDQAEILVHLGVAALIGGPGETIYLALGLPMRRSPDGKQKQHFAIWSLTAEAADSLRTSLQQESDTPDMQVLRAKIGNLQYEILELGKISWCPVLEDRPEIVVRRDSATPISWFRGRRIALLGCGALGSWTAEIVARARPAYLGLVDTGIVKPGLLARQNYAADDIGAMKCHALARRLKGVVEPGVVIESFNEDAHRFTISDIERFAGYDALIDCTASNIVQMKLERDWRKFGGRTPALISMITDAKAQQGLYVLVPAGASGGCWDAYVRLKYRLCNEESPRQLLDAFYDSSATKALFQPEPGCSDPTFAGSTADAMGVAASAINLASSGLSTGNVLAGAFQVPSGHGAVISKKLGDTLEVTAGDYRVRIAKNVLREVRGWVKQNNRIRSAAHETGGLLWGLWDDSVEIIWIFDASGPPSDSSHSPGHFVCGVDGTSAEHAARFKRSKGSSGFVGFWHTHPDMVPIQSPTDVGGMADLVATTGQNQKRCVMLIFGRADDRPSAGVYVYESDALRSGLEAISVHDAHIPLEEPIV